MSTFTKIFSYEKLSVIFIYFCFLCCCVNHIVQYALSLLFFIMHSGSGIRDSQSCKHEVENKISSWCLKMQATPNKRFEYIISTIDGCITVSKSVFSSLSWIGVCMCMLFVELSQKCQQYTEVEVRSSLPPHIYAISDAAYQNMLRNAVSQCCVVSGESGAG